MTGQNEKRKLGNPNGSYQLSVDLLETLKTCELFKSDVKNPYIFFDIMMGIAEFTRVVLKTMEASSKNNLDFYKFYKDTIMESMNLTNEEFISFLANTEVES